MRRENKFDTQLLERPNNESHTIHINGSDSYLDDLYEPVNTDYGDGLNDPINDEYIKYDDKISEEYDVDSYDKFIGE